MAFAAQSSVEKMKPLTIILAVLMMFVGGEVWGASDRWTAYPSTSINDLWEFVESENTKAQSKFFGATGLSWPDGRQAIVYHFQLPGFLWRCFNYFDADMRSTGGMCYRNEPLKGTITTPK